MRGHGRTALPADPAVLGEWDRFVEDLEALIETPDEPALLPGHSIGATMRPHARSAPPGARPRGRPAPLGTARRGELLPV